MDTQTCLRIGIVGCGYQGGIKARSLQESTDWHVVACAAPNSEAAAQVAAIAGTASVYPSVEEMLQHSEVDAFIVATSHTALYECSLTAIWAGKHVLAEKPIGMDEKEVSQLEDAVGCANICFRSGYSFRNIAAWQKVRELLDAGAVGEIHTIAGNIRANWLNKIGPQNKFNPIRRWYRKDDSRAGR